ncbi:MAG: hypothetical protein QOJ67_3740 [Acidimicrobiaceae bacterium]
MLRRAGAAGAFGVALILAVITAPSARGQAPERAAFALRATATGTQVLYTLRGALPIDQLVESSSLFAEAHLEQSRSTSLSAAPDPGSTVLSAPGLIDGFSGGKTDVPGYPLAASAEYPLTPESTKDAGPIHLVANAVADGANSVASQSGASGGAATGTADTGSADDGRLRARAVSSASDLVLANGAVSIGSVSSVVELAIGDAGPEIVENRTTVTGLLVGGVPVDVGDHGVVVADQPVDVGAVTGVLDQLGAPGGMTVRVVGPIEQQTDRGLEVTSGSVVIEVPGEVQGHPSTLRVVLGQANAAVSANDAVAASPVPATPSAPAPAPAPAAAALFSRPAGPSSNSLLAAPATRPATASSPAPASRAVATTPTAIDFRPVYLWLVALGVAAVRLQRWALVQARDRRQVSDLRPLWRW